MKRFLCLSTALLAIMACTPDAETESDKTDWLPVEAVVLDTHKLSLEPGDQAYLTGRVYPDNCDLESVSWSSSDTDVASVSQEGLVSAVAEGTCIITLNCDGMTDDCKVTVAAARIPVSSITLDYTSAVLDEGEKLQLAATVLPDDATDKTVTWTSSDTQVATVENGLVTALKAGRTVITATADGISATCPVTVRVPFNYGGMCMEAITSGSCIEIYNPNGLSIEFKKENDDWTSTSASGINIQVNAGDRVWFRGRNESYKGVSIQVVSGSCYLYGNLMSLIAGDGFDDETELTGSYTFFELFKNNTGIYNHPTRDIELPATTLNDWCYYSMFMDCVNLTRAPKLPAKVLAEGCYASMFAYCTSIKEFPEMAATDMAYLCCTWMMRGSGIEEAPELPAMNLAESCYEYMFMECPNLKKAMSVLPATELAPNCYFGMFQLSDKLENAPRLPATDLTYSCYGHMFNGCKALKNAPRLPATKLANSCYKGMFRNTLLKEAPELPATDMEVGCYQYMFQNCTELEKAPVLPATQLSFWCYRNMFEGCSKLNYIKALFLNKPSEQYTLEWVAGVAEKGTFVKNRHARWGVSDETRGINGIPEGWTVER